MSFHAALIAVAVLAAPSVVLAQTSEQTSTLLPVSAEINHGDDEKARMVCKRLAPTGSRTPGKMVCRTAGEWMAEEHAAKESLDDVSRRARQSAPRT